MVVDDRSDRAGAMASIRAKLVQAGRTAVRLALPPTCLACAAPVGHDGALCAACWSRFALVERPFCDRLAIPFAYEMGPGALSAEAIADPPPFARMRAVAVFDDIARRLVHGLKYQDHLELAGWMGTWMARAGQDVLAEADLVVPVPLHRWRLWRRRFNQSAALAVAAGRTANRPVELTALRRLRATRQQVGLRARARAENVRTAFAVPEMQRGSIAGKRVVLVDDVYTTGATAKAATRALLKGGAAQVDVLVFARVARGEN